MNLVNELQVSAERDDVLTVLRKTKRLASKLDRQDIDDWLKAEQNGYAPDQSVPEYRKIGTTLAYNTNGYIPAGYGHLKNGVVDLSALDGTPPKMLLKPISSIQSMIERIRKGNGIYSSIPEGGEYSKSIRSFLLIHPMIAGQITFTLHLNSLEIEAIPERIKDKILEWACALERAGVTGDGMTFTLKEKELAHAITFNITGSHIGQLNNMGTNQQGGQ